MAIEGKKPRSSRPEIFSNKPHSGSLPMKGGMGDFVDPFLRSIQPNPGALDPKGPVNFPITDPTMNDEAIASLSGEDLMRAILRTLRQVRDETRGVRAELHAMNNPGVPVLRSADATDAGKSLDFSAAGQMDRFLARNKGANSIWIAFDIAGEAVDAFTSDLSYELQAQESICIPRCLFRQIGCKCAGGETGTIHVVAFMATAGNLGLGIS